MQGLFSLNDVGDDDPEATFITAFQSYAQHLADLGLALRHEVGFRQPHDGYNLNSPALEGLAMIFFASLEQANACWDYVEANDEPVRSLHRGVQIRTAAGFQFTLTELASQ